METLQLLGMALGLSALAGVNLYLTVFAAGFAIHMNWVALAAKYTQLEILGDPWIWGIAGVLYFIEFFADKIPWVDSLWDVVHTVIRPIGGAFLAVKALGSTDPVFDVVIALLAGGVSLTTHATKAGTRLLVNTSPEPFTNILVSLGEDVGVLSGLALISWNPGIAFLVFLCITLMLLWLAPKIFRSFFTTLWLAWKKITHSGATSPQIYLNLPAEADQALAKITSKPETIKWSVYCLSGRGIKTGSNRFGYLVATNEAKNTLYFVTTRSAIAIDMTDLKITLERRLLSDLLVLYSLTSSRKYILQFNHAERCTTDAIVAKLQNSTALSEPVTPGKSAESFAPAAA